ncbi:MULTISPECIES: alpha/beta fold hydrolase [unclassified Sphingopyxis]|uniref:alpha/beta fold hydrolase n=1 Tax=unclassified Sphingopyxis TaxID=2614943 RepID=UPI00086B560D|nr:MULTISPECIES: alpha/beta hydrolase [unclassified Sphingopyxis]AVA13347.1 alpha/beta hydrolase [Sphingopyxis sp. MG]ODU28806.1 MAG: alpha/beta hydrolase [Sphingopyxis sp. SCN 67-31]
MTTVAPCFEPAVGRYITIDVEGRRNRVYVEQAGEGIPLLCLHTAGADSRQYRALMNDERLLSQYRVIAFDLPYHGKSSPPEGWERDDYLLTSDRYVATVMKVIEALGIDRPIVMGCSIGGRAVLHLALRHGPKFRAAIGLQSGLHAESVFNAQYSDEAIMNRPEAHGGEMCSMLISGLIGPEAPHKDRWETIWHYMQGGPGVFAGDLYYYFDDGDLRNGLVANIDTAVCPLYLLSGEYDYSAPPEAAEEVARHVEGAKYSLMPGLGHFPMSEDPERFLGYLRPVLDEIRARESSVAA